MAPNRSKPELQRILANVRCLKWSGEAQQRTWGLEWRLCPADASLVEDEAPPIDMTSGESWLQAMLRARLPEDERRSADAARRAFAAGRRWYTHDFRCRGRDDALWWFSEDVFVDDASRKAWALTGVVFGITPSEQEAGELRALRHALDGRVLARAAEQDAELDELHRTVAEWELLDAVAAASADEGIAMFGGRPSGLAPAADPSRVLA
ncbi:hypothetical protein HN371_19610 [Candidatus Poribacteria bacterium]|jgi:hypothetical protein|nr:hypothetical protein [Candidatus Poribacteria bacterium]MBT7804498.1 hypothetical protein [Candidatus Poribacteria bacterium]